MPHVFSTFVQTADFMFFQRFGRFGQISPARANAHHKASPKMRGGPSDKRAVFPSTNGEGSLIFRGAYRSRRSRLPLREIKISLCLLNFEGCGMLDLGEIYQFGPWKRFAFDFRQHTFAHPRWNHTPGAPALRTCVFALFPPFRRPPFATSSTTLAPGPHTHANAAL